MLEYIKNKEMLKKYAGGGETYVHNFNLKWRKGHLNSTIFEEYKDIMNRRILYLGCNAGTSMLLVSGYCKQVIGIDINKRALEKTESLFIEHKVKNAFVVHCNVLDMPFKDECFDGIYAVDFVEHIYPEDFKLMLKEVSRVMKRGSHLLVMTPTGRPGSPGHASKTAAFDPVHKIIWQTEERIKEYLTLVPNLKIVDFVLETRPNPRRPKEIHDDWKVLMRKI